MRGRNAEHPLSFQLATYLYSNPSNQDAGRLVCSNSFSGWCIGNSSRKSTYNRRRKYLKTTKNNWALYSLFNGLIYINLLAPIRIYLVTINLKYLYLKMAYDFVLHNKWS